jgi:hypothetical protein
MCSARHGGASALAVILNHTARSRMNIGRRSCCRTRQHSPAKKWKIEASIDELTLVRPSANRLQKRWTKKSPLL